MSNLILYYHTLHCSVQTSLPKQTAHSKQRKNGCYDVYTYRDGRMTGKIGDVPVFETLCNVVRGMDESACASMTKTLEATPEVCFYEIFKWVMDPQDQQLSRIMINRIFLRSP